MKMESALFNSHIDALHEFKQQLFTRGYEFELHDDDDFLSLNLVSGVLILNVDNSKIRITGLWNSRDRELDYRDAAHIANEWNSAYVYPFGFVKHDDEDPIALCAQIIVEHSIDGLEKLYEGIEEAIFAMDLYFSWLDQKIFQDDNAGESITMSRNWSEEFANHDNTDLLHRINEILTSYGAQTSYDKSQHTITSYWTDEEIPVVVTAPSILNKQLLVGAIGKQYINLDDYDIAEDIALLMTSSDSGIKVSAVRTDDACGFTSEKICDYPQLSTDEDVYAITMHAIKQVIDNITLLQSRV
ncbi:hypothetical protein EJ419_01065 [Alloscardovia theropitheci]|uniref:YbjN domain-containing protein n=1 Tax=Alloscardovia theropitheci TaxID=2496842 RepID=A0A4R0QYU1_9BIFI|nr:hypothetical protein [Alloscardovia theropitheci]TCD55010.1 hypothetical protein EJ419_01065 [Alloscardovia theropitheci]